jgi:iron(III) transport system substrate-binding protein
MDWTRRGGLAAIATVSAVWLATGSAVAEGVVNVYNARHYNSDSQLWDAFSRATGTTVRVVDGDHDALIQRMKAEGANSPADVFITVDAGRLALAAAGEVLQPVRSQELDRNVPAHLRHPDGLWYGLAMRARVIGYAKGRVDPKRIATYEALADPGLGYKVATRSSTHVYSLSLLGSIIEARGADAALAWCQGLVGNLARPPQGGDTDQIKAVAAGVADVAIHNTYYVARLLGSDKAEDRAVAEKVAIVFPNQGDRGTHVNISGAAVTRSAPNRANAIKFVEFLSGPEAQRYFADVNYEYPVNPLVKPHPILAEWGDFKQDTLNASIYAARSAEAARISDRCGWK